MLTLLLKGKSCYQVVSWMNVSYSMVKCFTLMSAALPSGSMVDPRTGSHLKTDPPSLEKPSLGQAIKLLNSRNLIPKISLNGKLIQNTKKKSPNQIEKEHANTVAV